MVISSTQVPNIEVEDNDLSVETNEEDFAKPAHAQEDMYAGLQDLEDAQLQSASTCFFEDVPAQSANVDSILSIDTPKITMYHDPPPPQGRSYSYSFFSLFDYIIISSIEDSSYYF